ncbi:MAG: phenylacetate--CoA ligase family protein [Lachnospira sp.]|nr:phenylacetate--CoA ligase family protein [Lachnospira sp.]
MNYFKLLYKLYKTKNNIKRTPAQIKELQERKLRKLLIYSYNHSRYYHKMFEKAGINQENISTTPLSLFPTIDKTQLLKNFDTIVTVSDVKQEALRRFDLQKTADRKPFKGRYHVVHSSGSTGKPNYFIYDETAWNEMLLGMIRAALWNMSMIQILKLFFRGVRVVYIAATDGRYGGAMAVGDGIDGIHAKSLYLDIKTPLDKWIRQIKEFQPNVIIGYPSAIKILGELVEKRSIQFDIFRVISCGEPLGASLRHYLENVFQAEVINFYGTSESLVLGVESNPKEGMILFDDMNVIEVYKGNMYLTCLYNFAQPLIRYRLTDCLTLQNADMESIYPFTKAVGLLGRNEDILWFNDGNGNSEFLHPLAIEGFCIEGLRDYQFLQIGKDAFEMLAEVSKTVLQSKVQKEILQQMKRILEEKKLSYVQFYVRFVDEILPDANTGKKRLIVIGEN